MNESAAPFSFIGAKSGSPRPELLSNKELMRFLAMVVELGEKRHFDLYEREKTRSGFCLSGTFSAARGLLGARLKNP